jgi:hypothetical protein
MIDGPPGTGARNTRRQPGGFSRWLRGRWLTAWVAFVVVLYAVPTLLLFVAQRRWLAMEKEIWEATLDPSRPDPGLNPPEPVNTERAKRVKIGFYMESIEHISVHDGGWSTILDVWCEWKHDDADPGFDPFDRLLPVNGKITASDVLRESHEGDRHYVHRRLELEFKRKFRVVNFPLDRHLLLASFENAAHTRDELLFEPDDATSAVSRRVSTAGYRIERFHAVENPHSYLTSRGWPGSVATRSGTWSQPRFAIEIGRTGWGLFLKMFQALFVSVGVALLACFIKPIHVDPRFGLGIGALFAAVANGYLVGTYVPETGEFSLADVVNLLGIGTIMLSMSQSTISLWIYETLDDPVASRHFDRVSFWTILGGFTASMAILVAGAVSRV